VDGFEKPSGKNRLAPANIVGLSVGVEAHARAVIRRSAATFTTSCCKLTNDSLASKLNLFSFFMCIFPLNIFLNND
jgi:hypothetical protein